MTWMWHWPAGFPAEALQGNPDAGHLFFGYGAAPRTFSFPGVHRARAGAVRRAPVFAAEQDRHDGSAVFHRAVDLSGLVVAQRRIDSSHAVQCRLGLSVARRAAGVL